jgi:hypothetical protein
MKDKLLLLLFLAVISAGIIFLSIKLNQKDNFVCKPYKKNEEKSLISENNGECIQGDLSNPVGKACIGLDKSICTRPDVMKNRGCKWESDKPTENMYSWTNGQCIIDKNGTFSDKETCEKSCVKPTPSASKF